MPVAVSAYADTPLEELDLEHRIWMHLSSLGVRIVNDLFNIPESVLRMYMPELLEGIERVKRDHAPPPDF